MHLPKTPETVGLIGDEQFATVKPSVIIVNAARGGIVDEHALTPRSRRAASPARASTCSTPSRAPTRPLFEFDSVVATPHLGASTDEAQEKAGVAVARSVRLALAGELVPDAVNVQGGVIAEDVRPGIPLAEKLGRFFTALAGTLPSQLDVEVRGEIASHDVRVLELAVLKGMFNDVIEEPVTYVNAPVLATDRGVGVRLVDRSGLSPTIATSSRCAAPWPTAARSRCRARSPVPATSRSSSRSTASTSRSCLSEHMAVFRYEDRPGIVGTVGRILGEANVNIAGMQVSRDRKGGHALSP